MFERFTDKSRRAVVLAQEEARLMDHGYIGTEHLLAGLRHEGQGTAAKALGSLGITTDAVRAEIETAVGRGQDPPAGHIPFTPQAKTCLERSLREALQLGHRSIGTGHLLLGLISGEDDVAVRILGRLGADLDQLRAQVLQEMEDHPEEQFPRGAQERPHDAIRVLLDAIDARLAAIERHLGIVRPVPVELRRYDQQIAGIRRDKEAAIERQDFEAAAAARDAEKRLLAERAQAVEELVASAGPGGAGSGAGRGGEAGGSSGPDEPAQLRAEIIRLRALLSEHDIDPGQPGDSPAAAG